MSTSPNNEQQGQPLRVYDSAPSNPVLSEADRHKFEELELAFAKAKRDLEISCRENGEASSLLTAEAHLEDGDSEQAAPVDVDGDCCPSCGRGASDAELRSGNLSNDGPIPPATRCLVSQFKNNAGEVATRYINTSIDAGNRPEWYAFHPQRGLIGAQIHGSINRLAERVREDTGCTRVFFSLIADLPEEFGRVSRNENRGSDLETGERAL
ncbi:hypothetical protein DER46DRAFT_81090 [Fusarium sp. MPI-SDFR-AT-0072]|uniref:Uncharacterized protein n=1 Tax=Fusarium oxysporum f. sp. rapae TaxID=485398 RepID=A0A8J5NY19_FUSOX|nr:hypothetical protein Forpe1208_v009794 [Fusarium oxysporum f. sp. rapae]KAH7144825.1 hypothetical protein DER46DRAFT_81090 [Fusarium sp. MPI-SDFR-AT-0072]KAI7770117.1 hypothetical protein LZL87_002488 [Fusarium oxysporum]